MTEPAFLQTTRTSYDAFADLYASRFQDELAAKPLDRGVLTGFAELVAAGGGGPVADIGCGTGRVTAHLHASGADVFGVDLSPGMLAEARSRYPGLRFEEGSMLALDLPDGGLGGLLAWYSTIHVPDERLPQVFAEFHRVLAPGGHLLLGFQAGDTTLHLDDAFGRDVSLDFRRRRPEQVEVLLKDAGLEMRARMLREADTESAFPEKTPQAFLIARKPLAPEPLVSGGEEDGATD
ncbi:MULTISPECIES: class I SAM-dependent methyltransferase [unclassified Streptomyces]|uniref:class I SAM-dependent DNA methyltransferase n=1 Tax=Streptomyces TaxID=1883 RepID=UPI0001C18962|nr:MULTISPECIES: class I SAM-dependent methyltransferase [unclassified Streptomyces]MYR66531.1 methyltransferase domain-containing protein [Streptomyces sp. SID4939]MYS04591.1 methyltransferase domain-containing protein [Streptomyces sp. SID4940]MYT61833.1 methyltransferase domain-containing protein [Streptomyces sp. SID8357]MYT85203.1 methyltransferase domain-containing protein [Streptomyces sp. SID8360]MYU36314.1 methyltransferase domain-containing protein [Streptomyces sp. SID8358]MYW39102